MTIADDELVERLHNQITELRAEVEELKQQRQGQGLLNVKLMREAKATELQVGVLVDLCRDSLAILEIQPDLVRTDSGERGDGELGEICPKLAAAIEKHKTNNKQNSPHDHSDPSSPCDMLCMEESECICPGDGKIAPFCTVHGLPMSGH